MTVLDKYILRSLVVSYLIALGVMISLYIMLDLFFNMDEFTEAGGGAARILGDIAGFYGTRVLLYFAQLSGVITLFASLSVLARMRRTNELTALLASGVSLYRVAAPVVVFALFTTGLWYVDTEVAIPSVAHKLARRHDDARGLRTYTVRFLNDRDGALLSAQRYVPGERMLKRMLVMKRNADGTFDSSIEAEEAHWEPDAKFPAGGRWRLERGGLRSRTIRTPDGLDPGGEFKLEPMDYYESDLDPKAIETRKSAGWIRFLSASRLLELETEVEGRLLNEVRQARYARFVTPLVNVIMLLLGLPFILDRMPGNILSAAARCLVVCGLCFLLTFVTQRIAPPASMPALPAWIPVLVFAPTAVVLLDRLRT